MRHGELLLQTDGTVGGGVGVAVAVGFGGLREAVSVLVMDLQQRYTCVVVQRVSHLPVSTAARSEVDVKP